MKTIRTINIVALLTIAVFQSCTRYKDYSNIPFIEDEKPAWEDPQVVQINKVPAHAHFIPFTTVEQTKTDDKLSHPLIRNRGQLYITRFPLNECGKQKNR